MTDEDTSTTNPTLGDTTGLEPGREYPGTPRWVKVSAIIAIGLVLLVVVAVLLTTALGLHKPPGGGLGGHTPPIEQGVQKP